jgi:uncharacterized membrane protein YccC
VSVEPSPARKGRIAVVLAAGLLLTLLIAVLLVPVVLRGEPPSPLEFLVAAGEALAIGFLLRTRSSERLQSIGFAILVLGLVAVAGAVTVMWIALGTCC